MLQPVFSGICNIRKVSRAENLKVWQENPGGKLNVAIKGCRTRRSGHRDTRNPHCFTAFL